MTAWGRRALKAGRYVLRGDLLGLAREIRGFLAWSLANLPSAQRVPPGHAQAEACFWDSCCIDRTREVGWAAAADFGSWAFEERSQGRWATVMDLIDELLEVPRDGPLYGLVLGCGDMVAEHGMFLHPGLPFAEVDAYDLSAESVERARQLTEAKGLKVNYHIADVNSLELPENRYALATTFHALHHFYEVTRVARQINRSLRPGGVFYLVDYVGPCRLQFTPRQLAYAQLLLDALPTRYRREPNGSIRDRVSRVPLNSLSPDEAVHSDQILPAIARCMRVRWQHNWAGLLYPLLEGLGANFDVSRADDLAILRLLYNLDRVLCDGGELEPNFTITIATKR